MTQSTSDSVLSTGDRTVGVRTWILRLVSHSRGVNLLAMECEATFAMDESLSPACLSGWTEFKMEANLQMRVKETYIRRLIRYGLLRSVKRDRVGAAVYSPPVS